MLVANAGGIISHLLFCGRASNLRLMSWGGVMCEEDGVIQGTLMALDEIHRGKVKACAWLVTCTIWS